MGANSKHKIRWHEMRHMATLGGKKVAILVTEGFEQGEEAAWKSAGTR